MRYAVIYIPLGIVAMVLTSTTLFEPVERNGYVGDFGSLWEIADRPAGEPARVGLMLGGVAIVLMWLSVVPRLRTAIIPAVVAGIGAICTLLLIVRPATGDPKPDLTTSGLALLLTAAVITVTALVQCVDYVQQGRRSREVLPPVGP